MKQAFIDGRVTPRGCRFPLADSPIPAFKGVRVSKSRGFSLLVLLLVLPLAGCLTWAPAGMSAEALMQQAEPPERVRVITNEGDELILIAPAIRAGALVATRAPGAVLLRDVASLEVEKLSIGRTIGMTIPGVIILTVVGIRASR